MVALEGAEFVLPAVSARGVAGADGVMQAVMNTWAPANGGRLQQLGMVAGYVQGMKHMRGVMNVSKGLVDLVYLPYESYQKEGTVLRGLQRGTSTFLQTLAQETLNVGSRLAAGTQVVLETADEYLGGRGSLMSVSPSDARAGYLDDGVGGGDGGRELEAERGAGMEAGAAATRISRFSEQPATTSEGLYHAARSVSRELRNVCNVVLVIPVQQYEREGTGGAMKAVVRAVPIAVIRPMIGVSEGLTRTLQGMRNQLYSRERARAIRATYKHADDAEEEDA